MAADYPSLIEQFRNQKVIVIGELMLDVYLSGTSNRISREAPVPVVDIEKREDMPGGAANTALNLAAMGAQVYFLSVGGKDRSGRLATALLRRHGVDTSGVIYDPARCTLTKKRLVSNDQLMVRFDYGTKTPITPEQEQQLIQRLNALFPRADAVLLSDYRYGVITPGVVAALRSLLRRERKLVVVDSGELERFRSLRPDAIKPNYEEALGLLGLPQEANGARVDQIRTHGGKILDITGASIAAITVDSDGAVIFEDRKTAYRTYAKPVPNSKAAGAGDTYISALTLALSLRCRPLDAAEIASAAAHVAVHKNGTAVCTAQELREAFMPREKIIRDRDELAARIRAYREQGRRIVFTNGCFDILHRGHIAYLAQAKERGDLLIVGVNDDDSVKRLKGPSRPVNGLDDRMVVLAALHSVDHVVGFSEDTPIELIKIIRPDIFVKGGDYTRAALAEAPVVEELGGRVEILPYIADQSTTNVIDKIRTANQVSNQVS